MLSRALAVVRTHQACLHAMGRVVAAHPDGHGVEHEDHLHEWIVVT